GDSIYLAGRAWSKESGLRLWVWRIDLAGNKLWEKEIVPPGHHASAPAVVGILPRRSPTAAGPSDGVRVVVGRSTDVKMISVDSTGGIEPGQAVLRRGNAQGALQLARGDLLLYGNDNYALQESRSWVARVSASGLLKWQQ